MSLRLADLMSLEEVQALLMQAAITLLVGLGDSRAAAERSLAVAL